MEEKSVLEMKNMVDVRPCIKFIESAIYDSVELESMQDRYKNKVAELSTKFSMTLAKYNKSSKRLSSSMADD